MGQVLLFGRESAAIDCGFRSARRHDLGRGAWIEHQSGWLSGHLEVFEALRSGLRWRAQRRQMWEREIDVPRLLSGWPNPADGAPPFAHAVVNECVEALSTRYRRDLGAVSLAYYRDGSDSVAPHGDRMGPLTDDCVIAIVAIGERRTFHLRPAVPGNPGAERFSFELGWGDLLVMGGTCQREFLHGIPKSRKPVGPRISIQFRQADPFARQPADQPRRGA